MSEGKVESRININHELSDKITKDIGSLREELTTIRHLLEGIYSPDQSLHRAAQEYRKLSLNADNPIRWGFMGAWGRGGAHLAMSVRTTSVDNFLAEQSNEDVAEFAKVFSDPRVIGICKCLFPSEDPIPRERLKQECNLSDEELDAALEPMLEWHFVGWQDDRLQKLPHGVNWAMTLIEMTGTAIYERRKQEEKSASANT